MNVSMRANTHICLIRPLLVGYHIPLTSKKDAFSGSSNLLKGPSFTVKPLLQNTILWTMLSGWSGAECTVAPVSNLPVPVKLLELDERAWSIGPSTAPICLAWLKRESTSFPFVGSWTSIPLKVGNSISIQ